MTYLELSLQQSEGFVPGFVAANLVPSHANDAALVELAGSSQKAVELWLVGGYGLEKRADFLAARAVTMDDDDDDDEANEENHLHCMSQGPLMCTIRDFEPACGSTRPETRTINRPCECKLLSRRIVNNAS